jgi:hypothetical protein
MKLGACGAKVFTYYVYSLNLEYDIYINIGYMVLHDISVAIGTHALLKFPDSA